MSLRLKEKNQQTRLRIEDLCNQQDKLPELKLMKEKVSVLSTGRSGTDHCQRQHTRQVNPKLHDMAHYLNLVIVFQFS